MIASTEKVSVLSSGKHIFQSEVVVIWAGGRFLSKEESGK